MKDELLEQARQNCISRAEALLEAELAQTRAKYEARLNPSETLVNLESFKLQLLEAKAAFAEDRIDEGLEVFSTVHDDLNRLCYKLSR